MTNIIPFPRKSRSLAERAAQIAKDKTTARLREEMALTDADRFREAYRARREALRNGSHFLDDPVFQATGGLL